VAHLNVPGQYPVKTRIPQAAVEAAWGFLYVLPRYSLRAYGLFPSTADLKNRAFLRQVPAVVYGSFLWYNERRTRALSKEARFQYG